MGKNGQQLTTMDSKKDPLCAIFLKSRHFEDIKYDTERYVWSMSEASPGACLGYYLGHHLGHVCCLGHLLEHVWRIIWACLGHIWGIYGINL